MKQIILLIATLFIGACTLFKKTTKTSELTTQSSLRELETTELILKRADKETQIFTYWNDSGFYQYQHIKEQIDQAKSGTVTMESKQDVKQVNATKESEPVNTWIYVVVAIGVLGCYLFFSKRHN